MLPAGVSFFFRSADSGSLSAAVTWWKHSPSKRHMKKKEGKKTVALAEHIIDDLGDFIQPTAEVKDGLPARSTHTFTHI